MRSMVEGVTVPAAEHPARTNHRPAPFTHPPHFVRSPSPSSDGE
jgi:hypothetical protein